METIMNSKRKIDDKAITATYNEKEKEAPEVGAILIPETIAEEISVYYPEQLFSPVPYNSFRCGNLWYKTIVLPGETREDAYDRAWTYLNKLVENQFIDCRRQFWERYNSMSTY